MWYVVTSCALCMVSGIQTRSARPNVPGPSVVGAAWAKEGAPVRLHTQLCARAMLAVSGLVGCLELPPHATCHNDNDCHPDQICQAEICVARSSLDVPSLPSHDMGGGPDARTDTDTGAQTDADAGVQTDADAGAQTDADAQTDVDGPATDDGSSGDGGFAEEDAPMPPLRVVGLTPASLPTLSAEGLRVVGGRITATPSSIFLGGGGSGYTLRGTFVSVHRRGGQR